MKTFIVVAIIASFLQSTILPLNLVLIILICRAYIRTEKVNLFLAFIFGLLVAHLTLHPLGLESLIFMIVIQVTQMMSRSPFSTHALLIIPLSFILLSSDLVAISILTQKSIHLMPQVAIESLLSLPIFYLVRVWEERFIIRKEIKLKV